jgi:hypothetical protein
MATITGKVTRMKGKDVSSDELSCYVRGIKYVPYRIGDASGVATALRGVILVSKGVIATHGDPDGEEIKLTLT